MTYQHYVRVDNSGRITDAWSTGPTPNKSTNDAVCINQEGGYQFRMTERGEENPLLYELRGIPLYKLVDGKPEVRTAEEIAADITALPAPQPTVEEQQLAAMALQQAQQANTITELQQANAALMLKIAGGN